jgi:hypothetical protein
MKKRASPNFLLFVLVLLNTTGCGEGLVKSSVDRAPALTFQRLFCEYNLRMRGGSGARAINSAAAVERVIATADYYEILEVSRGCTEDDVKKAYRYISCLSWCNTEYHLMCGFAENLHYNCIRTRTRKTESVPRLPSRN